MLAAQLVILRVLAARHDLLVRVGPERGQPRLPRRLRQGARPRGGRRRRGRPALIDITRPFLSSLRCPCRSDTDALPAQFKRLNRRSSELRDAPSRVHAEPRAASEFYFCLSEIASFRVYSKRSNL